MIGSLALQVRLAIGAAAVLASFAAVGCFAPAPKPHQSAPSAPFQLTVIGDWNDVEASLFAVIGKAEMAILSKTDRPNEQVYELLSVGDEPGFVYARRQPGDKDDLIPITLSCSLGFFGDPAGEKDMVSGMAARLNDLAGVGARPIR